MVVAPGVEGRERPALLVVRPVPDEVLPARMRQLVDGAFEPEASELLRLTGSRPETGAPKQPLGLGGPERPPPHGDTRHARGHRQRSAHTGSPIEGARSVRGWGGEDRRDQPPEAGRSDAVSARKLQPGLRSCAQHRRDYTRAERHRLRALEETLRASAETNQATEVLP